MSDTESEVVAESFSGKRLLVAIVGVLVVGAACYSYGVNSVKTLKPNALRMVGLDDPVEHSLGAQYTDADGDLVADPPRDEAQWIDPATINFSYLASE
ncbi:MAG: hypothetical protein ACR2NM_07040 [Bythopirellula sp.]